MMLIYAEINISDSKVIEYTFIKNKARRLRLISKLVGEELPSSCMFNYMKFRCIY